MNKLMIGLSAAALLQLMLAFALWWEQQQQPAAVALLTLDPKQLTEIKLEHQGKSLQLVYKDGEWLLPELQHEPARSAKVESLITQLEKSRLQWPVAQTDVSQERLDVAEDKFQWKLTLTAQGQSQQIYLGSASAFKQLYLRRDGEADIYQQRISTLDWSTDPKQWFDQNSLQLNQISRIQVQGTELLKDGGQWQVRSLQTQGQLQSADPAMAEKLVNIFSRLQVAGPALSTVLLAEQGAQEQLEVEVQSFSGKYRYQLKKGQQNYLLKRDDKELWYPLAAEQVKLLFELDSEQLLAQQPQVNENATGTAVKNRGSSD